LENLEIYDCEHNNSTVREIQSNYTVKVCSKCFEEFKNLETRPLFLAKQILSVSNKMIEKTPEYNDGQTSNKSIKLWHDCNTDVLEQLKKLNILKEDKINNLNTIKDETNYNFDQILHETEIDKKQSKQEFDGKNLHDLYRHSTKLIK
jgi:hypothetical protein